VRDGAGEGSTALAGDDGYQLWGSSSTDVWDEIRRSIYTLDTSALTSGATVSAAVFSLYGTAKNDNMSDSVGVVGSTPASDNALVNADYGQVGATLYAPVMTVAAVSTSAYNDFTFNATGRAAISKTGITKLGLRGEMDRSDTPSWSNTYSTARFEYADETGTDKDPKLVITYTAGGTPKNDAETMGIADADSPPVVAQSDSETLGIADAATLAATQSDSDVFGIADAESLAVSVTDADVLGLVDDGSVVTGHVKNAPETLGLADAASLVVFITDSDVLGIADSEYLTRPVSDSDTIGLADAGSVNTGVLPWDVTSRIASVPQDIISHEADPLGIISHTSEPQ